MSKKSPLLQLNTQLDQDFKTMISPITEKDELSPIVKSKPFEGRPKRTFSRKMPDYSNDSDFEYSGEFSFGAGGQEKGDDNGHSNEGGHSHSHHNDDGHSHSHTHDSTHNHEHEHEHDHNHSHNHDNTHDHEHEHNHGHGHIDGYEHDHSHGHEHSRSLGHDHRHEHTHDINSDLNNTHLETHQSPLNNFIIYIFPFLNDDSKTPITSISSFIQQLASNKETKSIFRFLLLNFTFMFIQMLYSFRSKSLGLFSDSLHMLLDCSSLAIGLFAKLISKKIKSTFYEDHEVSDHNSSLQTNQQAKSNIVASTIFSKYPFGLARIETLAAFVNGILLLSIVQDIFFQSIDRILNPVSLRNINELLVVSTLGLLVNLVGIFAFNHGHDDDDDEGHGHSHSLKGLFGSEKSTEVPIGASDDPYLQELTSHEKSRTSSTSDNDHGIFLHILADTLGSLGVIISTILLKFFPSFKVLDPFSSLFIIALILLSSIPLIKNSFLNLLLVLNSNEKVNNYATYESLIKDMLNDLYEIQGVVDITKIKIWKDENGESSGHSHGHSHGSSHGHSHGHSHTHNDEKSNDECGDKRSGLIGYVHIVYSEGENSTIIKKRCEKIIFEEYKVDLFIQLENEAWRR